MNQVSFLTAVSFGNHPKTRMQGLLEAVDDYFYLWGKKACVIPGNALLESEGAILQEGKFSYLSTALKVLSYTTLILPALFLIAKIVLRSMYTFHIIAPSQPQVEESSAIAVASPRQIEPARVEELSIPPDAIPKIRQLMPKILQRAEDAEITWYHTPQNLVFSLACTPHLIFKTVIPGRSLMFGNRFLSPEEVIHTRFANMQRAKEVCQTYQLDLLVVPQAKKILIDGTPFIVEECLPLCADSEELYRGSNLQETARQLALFIAKTGFSDVEWRNLPLLQEANPLPNPRKVALIDLEEMESAEIGIFGGGFGRRGLISCLHTEEQIDLALAEAERQGVSNPEIALQVKQRRMAEIQSDLALDQFYVRSGITDQNAKKPIRIENLEELGLDLEEVGYITVYKGRKNGSDETSSEFTSLQKPILLSPSEFISQQKPILLRQAVQDVIDYINEAIQQAPEKVSIKEKRSILLDTRNHRNMQTYEQIGRPKGSFSYTEQVWLRRIIKALVEKGYLFKLDKVAVNGYYVQA